MKLHRTVYIFISGMNIEGVEQFKYLESVVSADAVSYFMCRSSYKERQILFRGFQKS